MSTILDASPFLPPSVSVFVAAQLVTFVSDETDEGQQGQRAQRVGNQAHIDDHVQRRDARDGRVAALVLFVDEFVDQDDDRAGEGAHATGPGPRIDPAEQEIHGEEPAPG